MTYLLLVLGLVSWGLDDITDIIRSDDAQTAIGVVDAFVQASREISERLGCQQHPLKSAA